MRQEMIIPSLRQRLTDRASVGLLLLVGGMFCLFRVMLGPSHLSAAELVTPFLMLFAQLVLAPIPWQWTGDDAPMASVGRGFLQSLVFGLLWVGLLVTLLHLLSMERPPDVGPPPGLDLPPPGGPHGPGPGGRPFPALGLGVLNLAASIIFGWLFAGREATRLRELRTAGLLRQARSQALQGQLEPHVLYNALNSLSELVHEDPAAAEEMIARLADLYRMLTRHGEVELLPLAKERQLVEAYLAMESMRLGPRLRVRWAWPAWADDLRLPPLLLQPLAENAIKHGISPCDTGGELELGVVREGARVALFAANTGLPLAPGAKEGVGLGNLRERLELRRELDASLTLGQEGDRTVARVSMKEKP
ncbi:sensor histidine kinase [Mesoterricola sediminis]|uniref:Signal transduction histidine kinase internal region domain-containing protein n=1 Tax=Mesoterricola sediminis TaxID=2927980 RepID=A0AA48GN36_9BACT|nr:histidine kinase [Mesoterricola sediminis]BDU76121.1 hypothetical protein METESE_10790 [Mesoterricola sediminis]